MPVSFYAHALYMCVYNRAITLHVDVTQEYGDDNKTDTFAQHFGPDSIILTDNARHKADAGLWTVSNAKDISLGGSRIRVQDIGDVRYNVEELRTQKLVSSLSVRAL